MLKELWSDKFISNDKIRDKIVFNENLNVVLGADHAVNSIGKSTFLMIIDFVFGGDDYIEKTNYIIANVGHHSINFMFQFNSKKYYFSRNTEDYKKVLVCNENYVPADEIGIDKYRDLLFEKYNIGLPYISFRNIVSRYFRVYGRDNSNEQRPLHVFPKEKTGLPVNSLIQLFNKYEPIDTYQRDLDYASDKKSAHNKAQKYTLIPSINKSTYTKNITEIKKLELELEQIQYAKDDMIATSLDQTDEFIKLKIEHSKLKRARSSLFNEFEVVSRKIEYSENHNNYEALSDFFENVNVKQFEDINNFHTQIYQILINEFEESKEKIQIKIDNITENMLILEKLMEATGYNQNVPKSLVQRISTISTNINRMKNENNQYDKSIEFKKILDAKKQDLFDVRRSITRELSSLLNKHMDTLNDKIYNGEKTPPQITFFDNNDYLFEVINDAGTGAKYRGMLIFDLVILDKTPLPALIHDSFLYKNVEDQAVQEILKLYQTINKQIFISLDKIESYSDSAQSILKSNQVIYLSPNGNELFGKSWNKKKQS
jgi:hypothetical protein